MKNAKTSRKNRLLFRSLLLLSLTAALPATARAEGAWNEFKYGNNTLGFHGYFRTSTGQATKDGDVMPVFIAPGAQSKYRLGNESDSNGEALLDYHYYLDGAGTANSRYVQLLGMLSDFAENPDYADFKIDVDKRHNPQSFIRLGNFLGDGVNVWFGRRYYDRRDIHMIDHYWLNVAQGSEYGGGIEGIPLGVGRMDIAAFTNEDRKVADLNGGAATSDLYSHTLDVRYRGIPTFKDGDLTLWGFGAEREANDTIHFGSRTGFGLGGWHTQQNIMGGRLVTGLAYRRGVALQQGLWDSHAVREDQGFDTERAYSVELNNDWFAEYKDKDFAMQVVNVLRREDRMMDAAGGGSSINWVSAGARPVFFLNDNFSLATEVGVDYVDNRTTDQSGFLGKGTVALQITKQKGFYERPMIKLFVTEAVWSKSFRGSVGNATPTTATSYANDTSGTSVGVQFEWWW